MAGRLSEHTVLLGGVEHTVLLDEDDVKRYGLDVAATAPESARGQSVQEKQAQPPANKARSATNKAG